MGQIYHSGPRENRKSHSRGSEVGLAQRDRRIPLGKGRYRAPLSPLPVMFCRLQDANRADAGLGFFSTGAGSPKCRVAVVMCRSGSEDAGSRSEFPFACWTRGGFCH